MDHDLSFLPTYPIYLIFDDFEPVSRDSSAKHRCGMLVFGIGNVEVVALREIAETFIV